MPRAARSATRSAVVDGLTAILGDLAEDPDVRAVCAAPVRRRASISPLVAPSRIDVDAGIPIPPHERSGRYLAGTWNDIMAGFAVDGAHGIALRARVDRILADAGDPALAAAATRAVHRAGNDIRRGGPVVASVPWWIRTTCRTMRRRLEIADILGQRDADGLRAAIHDTWMPATVRMAAAASAIADAKPGEQDATLWDRLRGDIVGRSLFHACGRRMPGLPRHLSDAEAATGRMLAPLVPIVAVWPLLRLVADGGDPWNPSLVAKALRTDMEDAGGRLFEGRSGWHADLHGLPTTAGCSGGGLVRASCGGALTMNLLSGAVPDGTRLPADVVEAAKTVLGILASGVVPPDAARADPARMDGLLVDLLFRKRTPMAGPATDACFAGGLLERGSRDGRPWLSAAGRERALAADAERMAAAGTPRPVRLAHGADPAALPPDVPVVVHHVTDADTAAIIATEGFKPGWGDVGHGVYLFANVRAACEYRDRGGWDGMLGRSTAIIVTTTVRAGDLARVIPDPAWPHPERYRHILWVDASERENDGAWRLPAPPVDDDLPIRTVG